MLSIFTQVLVLFLVALSLWLYWRRCRYWANRLRGITTIGTAYPLIGHLYKFIGAYKGNLRRGLEIGRQYGILETRNPTLVWLGETPGVGLFRAEEVEHLAGSTQELLKPDLMYGPVRVFFGSGLITLNGEAWQHHRKVLTPAFHFKILERYVEVFRRQADVLVQDLCRTSGSEVDAMPLMAKSVSHTICETAFGMSEQLLRTDELKKREEFFKALDVAFRIVEMRVLKPWLMVDALYRLSPLYSEQKKAEAVITEYASRIVRMKKEEIALEQEQEQSLQDDAGVKNKVAFLDLVLRDAKNLLSEDEILNEVRTLVTVQQTTSSTLAFIFVMLAIHQDVQEKVYREICELDDLADNRSYFERLGEMKYLERVIKETMRLYPVSPVFSRQLKNDLVLPSCTVPAGCLCFVHIFVMQRDKRIFGADAERFDPDHFLPERCRGRHPYAYMPFSAGPRNCIGQKYAMLQMKAIVSTVVRSIQIFTGKGCNSQEEIDLDIDTFLYIIGGFNVRFQPRKSKLS